MSRLSTNPHAEVLADFDADGTLIEVAVQSRDGAFGEIAILERSRVKRCGPGDAPFGSAMNLSAAANLFLEIRRLIADGPRNADAQAAPLVFFQSSEQLRHNAVNMCVSVDALEWRFRGAQAAQRSRGGQGCE